METLIKINLGLILDKNETVRGGLISSEILSNGNIVIHAEFDLKIIFCIGFHRQY